MAEVSTNNKATHARALTPAQIEARRKGGAARAKAFTSDYQRSAASKQSRELLQAKGRKGFEVTAARYGLTHALALIQPVNRYRVYVEAGITSHDLEIIVTLQGGCCFYCERRMRANEYCTDSRWGKFKGFDHVRPLCLGGTHSVDNLRLCCKKCNRAKWFGLGA